MEEIGTQVAWQTTATFWVSILAIAVAAAALTLEVRRWVESAPRLYVKCIPDLALVKTIGSDELFLVNHVDPTKQQAVKPVPCIGVEVSNRGGTATSILSLGYTISANWSWNHLSGRRKTDWMIDPSPGEPLPKLLNPGEIWRGQLDQIPEVAKALDAGQLWAQVLTSHRNKPARVRVRRKSKN